MKTDNPKIDIYLNGQYACSTTWAKTCQEAAERYRQAYSPGEVVTAHFSQERKR